MYFKDYILPLWYFGVPIILLLCSIYYFLYRILVARKFEVKRRIKKANFIYLYLFIGVSLIITSLLERNNDIVFLGIILIGQGFWIYDYNFVLNEGILIKGRVIPWNNISNLNYKNNKVVIISYFKNKSNSKISKVTFNIEYHSRIQLENTLKDKQDNINITNVENGNKTYSVKSIKVGLSLALIFLTMIFGYGLYNLLQPKSLGVVLEETFKHRETSAVRIYYHDELKTTVSPTSKEERIREVKNYLNSLHVRKIQFKDNRYKYRSEGLFEITLYELNGDEVQIAIYKKEPIIEITRDKKKRGYFIEEGYEYLDFLNEVRKSMN